MTWRMFIDPASHSTGWALFADKRCKASGTVRASDRKTEFFRLHELGTKYLETAQDLIQRGYGIDEVHIENVPWSRITTKNGFSFTLNLQPIHRSIGVIGAALAEYADVAVDVQIKSWQKAVGWVPKLCKSLEDAERSLETPLRNCVASVKSLDELAAIGMGIYWVNKAPTAPKLGGRREKRETA